MTANVLLSCRVLRLAPFDDSHVWKQMIGCSSMSIYLHVCTCMYMHIDHTHTGKQGIQRLKAVVSTLVLRRTKEELGDDSVSVV